jgi:hypothetical protein
MSGQLVHQNRIEQKQGQSQSTLQKRWKEDTRYRSLDIAIRPKKLKIRAPETCPVGINADVNAPMNPMRI